MKSLAPPYQNVVSVAYKPSSVIGGHLSRPIVTDGFKRNPESIDGPSQSLFRFLLRAGFTSRTSRQAAGELLPHLSTLTRQACGISLLHFPWGRPRRPLAVILALWSSDFPRMRPFGVHPQLSGLLAKFVKWLDFNTGFRKASDSSRPTASGKGPHSSCAGFQIALLLPTAYRPARGNARGWRLRHAADTGTRRF